MPKETPEQLAHSIANSWYDLGRKDALANKPKYSTNPDYIQGYTDQEKNKNGNY